MKKIFTILFILPLLCTAGTNYYVATTGDDATGNGTAGNPWKTLYKACTTVTTAYDTIRLGSGVFSETLQCSLSPKVQLYGAGKTLTTIKSSLTDQYTAMVVGISTVGTLGDQTVWGIKFDGQSLSTGWGLQFQGRSKIRVLYCDFINFLDRGCIIAGRDDGATAGAPAVYADSCKFNYNTMDNCARWNYGTGTATGALNIGGLTNFEILYDTIYCDKRADFYNGFPIKNYNEGFLYAGIIGYCYLKKAKLTSSDGDRNWSFSIELSDQSGIEIKNNTFIDGGIDYNRATLAHGQTYSTWVHDNYGIMQTRSAFGETFITFDYAGTDMLIERNIAINYTYGILFSVRNGDSAIRVTIRNNLFDSVNGGKAIDLMNVSATNYTTRDIRIYNNTLLGYSSNKPQYLVNFPFQDNGTNDSLYFINNNCGEFVYCIRKGGPNPLNYFWLQKNNFYHFTDTTSYAGGAAPHTNYTNNGNISVVPTYGANKTLQAGSALIDAGLNYFSQPYNGAAPDIGYAEYGTLNSSFSGYIIIGKRFIFSN